MNIKEYEMSLIKEYLKNKGFNSYYPGSRHYYINMVGVTLNVTFNSKSISILVQSGPSRDRKRIPLPGINLVDTFKRTLTGMLDLIEKDVPIGYETKIADLISLKTETLKNLALLKSDHQISN